MSRVVVVGSVNADLLTQVAVHPAPGETVLGRSMSVLAGGKGANQAVAAARLGAEVAFVGAVGDDSFAGQATAGLRAAGVDLSALTTVPGPTGIALVTVSADGENSIVVISGANATVEADTVSAHAATVAGADVVVLQGEIPRAATETAARLARGRVVLNLAPVIELSADVVRRADPLVVNEHEARLALSLLGGQAVPDDDHAAAARALTEAGVSSVVITLGSAGAVVATRSGDGEVAAVPSPKVSAVDTTGAGDAFVGALASRLAAGDELLDAARLAARVGAYAVTGIGAQSSYPSSTDALPEVR
ncbi:ribokinase [Promicromonospora sp. NPDC050249]|uniref:ribokinase n=1 Tax=Promicromonospora sp. NPDC050249 TaxID=3154743 RepID=UPI0033DDBFFE